MVDHVHTSKDSEGKSEVAGVDAVIDRLCGCVKDVSHAFGRWGDTDARGPGLYFVVERDSMAEFVGPMGANRWPIEECASVFDGTDAFLETAQAVAFSCDGAVVVHSDGTIEAEMVRVKQLSPDESGRVDLPYEGWMGARHMSALETSTRPEVAATITLSEEDGRVTVFSNGGFDDFPAESFGSD